MKTHIVRLTIWIIVVQAWIISVNGCAWNGSFLVILAAIVFGKLVWEEESCEKCKTIEGLIAGAFSMTCAFLCWFGIKYLGISGSIIISFLNIKIVIVLAGFFILGYWGGRKWKILVLKERIATVLSMIFTGFSFGCQWEISLMSSAGWILGAVLFLKMRKLEANEREKKATMVLSGILAFFCVMGKWEMWKDRIDGGMPRTVVYMVMLLAFLGWVYAFFVAILTVNREISQKARHCELSQKSSCRRDILMYCGTVIAWIPYFCVFYPGLLSTDSIIQVSQAIGKQMYSNHHPWAHTLLIQVCMKIGSLLGENINIQIAVYTGMVLLGMAFCITYAIKHLRQKGCPEWLLMILWCFYALWPINAVYMSTMWKDVIFAGIVLLFAVRLEVLIDHTEQDKADFRDWIIWSLTSIGVCLFRSNGLFAWLFSMPFFVPYFVKKKRWIGLFGGIGSVIMCVLIYKAIIMPAFSVAEPDMIESLSIPAQQIACVLKEEGEITEEEIIGLKKIVDTEKVKEAYLFYISDPVKKLVREKGNQDYLEKHAKDYLKIWIQIGIRNPELYVQAYVNQTKGYWYYKIDSWIYYSEGLCENELGIVRTPLLSENRCKMVYTMLDKSIDLYHRYSGVAIVFWISLWGISYSWIYQKSRLRFLLPVGITLTLLIAAPVYAEFRYQYAVFLTMPVLVLQMIYEVPNKKRDFKLYR